MRCNTLINILDDYNDDVAYISKFIKPKRVINITNENNVNNDVLADMRKFLSKELMGTKIIEKNYRNPFDFRKLLNDYMEKDTIINISSGDNLSAVIAHEAMIDHNSTLIYMDILEERIYKINKNGTKVINYHNVNFRVRDYVSITGGKIVTDETFDYIVEDYNKMLKVILNNYDMWITTRDFIRNNLISQSDQNIIVKSTDNNGQVRKLFDCFIDIGCVKSIKEDDNSLKIEFKNEDIRSYILSGIWLEHFTYNIVYENKKVSDVRTGVRFLWDEDKIEVENELDVIAVAGTSLICISCKDTKRYNSGSLNELDIYAEQLGGKGVKKILVATKPSKGQYVDERAERMGINLIIFNGDVDKFRKSIDKVIES
ncbi:hypothetical protein SH1V18_10590 [Vallitalea longa]|uniref:Card1 endonuclease domain-containing protein n=1 Tax=Vallitalea longa TaxID=2936439 RepID=A0A9W6DFD3_9FIRM|nr:DUF1887 family CARF protein [Vallitalea longa]GKX28579.1 hypothetical protein SH1V18_10590 [Vallitalea longa]